METSFTEWLGSELRERGWSHRELSRRAKVSHTWVNSILAGQTEPTWDFCAAIARPLGLQPIEVFRLAKLLPALPARTKTRERLTEVVQTLSESDTATLLRIAEAFAQTAPDPALSDEHRQALLEQTFRLLPMDYLAELVAGMLANRGDVNGQHLGLEDRPAGAPTDEVLC